MMMIIVGNELLELGFGVGVTNSQNPHLRASNKKVVVIK